MNNIKKKVFISIVLAILLIAGFNTNSFASVTINGKKINSINDFKNFFENADEDDVNAYFDKSDFKGKTLGENYATITKNTICWHTAAYDETGSDSAYKVLSVIDINPDGISVDGNARNNDSTVARDVLKKYDALCQAQANEGIGTQNFANARDGFVSYVTNLMKTYETSINELFFSQDRNYANEGVLGNYKNENYEQKYELRFLLLEWQGNQPYVIAERREVDQTGKLEIYKKSSTTDMAMPDVKFTIQNSSGKYYTTNGNFRDNINDNCYWTTNEYGKITIDNIKADTYTVTEVEQPNFGYIVENKSNKTDNKVEVKSGKTGKITFTNTSQLGNLTITKIDNASKKEMSGVKFTLQKNNTGYYANKYIRS